MYKDVAFQTVFQGLTLVLLTVATLTTASILGPEGFGRYASFQAIAVMLTPFVTLRLETRIASCTSLIDIRSVLSASLTAALIFAAVAFCLTPILAINFDYRIILMVACYSTCSAVLDALLNGYSFYGNQKRIVSFRSLRQVLPALTALFFAWKFSSIEYAVVGLCIGTALCIPVLFAPMSNIICISWVSFKKTIKDHSEGLLPSLVLGCLNAIWANSLLPLLTLAGLSATAGQYSLVQRIINAPLSVVSMSIGSVLLKSGNDFHLGGTKIAKNVALLFSIAMVLVILVYMAIYVQDLYVFPFHWRLDLSLFWSASLFFCSSFAVGSVSVICVRLKDEWFVAIWQGLLIIIWIIVLLLFNSSVAFTYMLLIGSVGYLLLLYRWVRCSEECLQ